MKKRTAKKTDDDEILGEYAFQGPGVRGKYVARCADGTSVVLLDEGGSVEAALRKAVRPGSRLTTYGHRAEFVVEQYDDDGMVLLLGAGRHRTRLPWPCLEGIPEFLSGRGWVVAGGQFSTEGQPDTLDEYLKQWLKRDVARWLARVLETAGVVEVAQGRPLRLRLRSAG